MGARQTGKSSLIKKSLQDCFYINLLNSSERIPLQSEPARIQNIAKLHSNKVIVIDEIQKIPSLLDEVHSLIESDKNLRFLLTGSSSRKLKKEGANMLAGRARMLRLHPLTFYEISTSETFDLDRALLHGLLPAVYLSDEPEEMLGDYIDVYLRDEIAEECRIRNLDGFERFLYAAAHMSGSMINYSNIANDAGLPESSVRSYFQILDDSLVAYRLDPWQSPIRKAVRTQKFYLFDIGIKWQLQGVKNIQPKTPQWGDAFEHFIIQEVIAYKDYKRKRVRLSYWRDKHKNEVDLIIDDRIAIEIKTTTRINRKDLRGLVAIKNESSWQMRIVVSFDQLSQITNEGIYCYYYEDFLKKLWDGNFD